jgi:hypothetical protein
MTTWEDAEIAAELRPLVESVAAAIANARGGRRGVPTVKNILDVLPQKLVDEVMDDARAAIDAVRAFDDAQIVWFLGEPT